VRCAFEQTISQLILISWTSFFFSDEENVHLSAHVNKRNMRFWDQVSFMSSSIVQGHNQLIFSGGEAKWL